MSNVELMVLEASHLRVMNTRVSVIDPKFHTMCKYNEAPVARGLLQERQTPAISTQKCSCQKLASHVQLLVNL